MTTNRAARTETAANRRTLRRQLTRSHLTVAALGLAALGIGLLFVIALGRDANRLATVRGPAVRYSTLATLGVQQSLAALRGWIVLGDDTYRKERDRAWRDQIAPAMSQLKESLEYDPSPAMRRDFERLWVVLRGLKESQWWIEDVAQTPGNQPARVVMAEDLEPSADAVFWAITACIDVEKTVSGEDRHSLLALMADLRGFFSASRTELVSCVDRELDASPGEFRRLIAVAEERANSLWERQEQLVAEQLELLSIVRDELKAYQRHAEKAIAVSDSDQWNVARYRLENEAAPAAREATELLAELTAESAQLMQSDADDISRSVQEALAVSAVLVVAMAVAAIVISHRRAVQLSEPIAALSHAAEQIATGGEQDDLPILADNELGRLTATFNTMRRRLHQRTVELSVANHQLHDHQRRLRAIIHWAPIAMVMIDRLGKIVLLNAEAESLFGYPENELLGREVEVLLPLRYREAHAASRDLFFAKPTLRRMGEGRELLGLRKDGTEISIEIALNPVESEDGVMALGAIVDVTARKQSEALLIEARRQAENASRAKSEFLANMSHEIRTPMTAILGYADLLLDEHGLSQSPPEYGEAIQSIQRNGEHLLTIINDILDMSKIEAGKMEVEKVPTNPAEIVSETVSLMRERAESKGLSIAARFDSPIPERIDSDPTRLRQILLNLVGNGLKFTEQGGVFIYVDFDEGASLLRFRVVDTGIGMRPEQRDAIARFDAFTQADSSTTRRFGGSGLGLKISNSLAKMLRGGLQVESTFGIGSEFILSIAVGELSGVRLVAPESDGEATGASGKTVDANHETCSLRGLRLLLAEDGPDNQRLISFVLKKAGAEIQIVENGKLAMEAALFAKDSGDPHDLVLMDMQMPEMDGYTATRKLRDSKYDVPIIALTAHAMSDDRQKCLDAGCNDYATKPIDRAGLISVVAKHARRRTDKSLV